MLYHVSSVDVRSRQRVQDVEPSVIGNCSQRVCSGVCVSSCIQGRADPRMCGCVSSLLLSVLGSCPDW
jgi:hypothetical protein